MFVCIFVFVSGFGGHALTLSAAPSVYFNNYKLFFETIPRSMWYLLEGQPVIAIWTFRNTEHSEFKNYDYLRQFLQSIKAQFKKDFGVEPALVPSHDVFSGNSNVKEEDTYCTHDWFSAGKKISYKMVETNGRKCGAMCPGYRTKDTVSPCHKSSCHEILRKNGKTLEVALIVTHTLHTTAANPHSCHSNSSPQPPFLPPPSTRYFGTHLTLPLTLTPTLTLGRAGGGQGRPFRSVGGLGRRARARGVLPQQSLGRRAKSIHQPHSQHG